MLTILFHSPKAVVYSIVLHACIIAGVSSLMGFGRTPFGKSDSELNSTLEIFNIEIVAPVTETGRVESRQTESVSESITESLIEISKDSVREDKTEPEIFVKAALQQKQLESVHKDSKLLSKSKVKPSQPQLLPEKILKQSRMEVGSEIAPRGDGDGIQPESSPGSILLTRSSEIQFSPKPHYPSIARRIGFEGKVELQLQITESGSVQSASVSRSSGREDCDENARQIILDRWRFLPALKNGEAVSSVTRVIVSYRLK